MKLAVVGSRHLTCKNRVYFELNELRKTTTITEIVSGLAPDDEKQRVGIDLYAREYAADHKIKYTGFPAQWNDFAPPCVRKRGRYGDYNALAGPNRNTLIADYCDQGLVIWDGKSPGTKDVGNKIYLRGKLLKKIVIPK